MYMKRITLGGMLFALLSLAPAKLAADVNVLYDGNHTVTTGQLTISIPQIWMQEGHAYTVTTRPVSGQTSAYGDPYIWSVTYDSRFFGGRRVVYQSRHANDSGERGHLQKDMWNVPEDRAEFWVRCETSASSCVMRVTVYEREAGTLDRKTFYREGVEYGVIDGQFPLPKEFYHSTRKNGDYGLKVSYEAGRYMYLYRNDGFDTAGTNALSLWLQSSGSIDEDDLSIALTTGEHQMITDWLPMSKYVSMTQINTWYRAAIPLSDLNPSSSSIRGLAIMSNAAGSVHFDDIRFTSEVGGGGAFKIRLPLNDYTPYNVPVSAVMDNSLGVKGVITTYNGQEGRFERGCQQYRVVNGVSRYDECVGSVANYNPPTDILGYKKVGGGLFTLGIAYGDGVSGNEYIFYDEHTGYDFLPAGASSLTVPVLAAAGGIVSYGISTWNEVIITHGDGYTTHYLHMERDQFLVPDGAKVEKGERIGTVGDTGPVSPHLHLTVKRDGTRLDPYRLGLWE